MSLKLLPAVHFAEQMMHEVSKQLPVHYLLMEEMMVLFSDYPVHVLLFASLL